MLTESAFRNVSGRLFVIVALSYGLADLPNAARQRPRLSWCAVGFLLAIVGALY